MADPFQYLSQEEAITVCIIIYQASYIDCNFHPCAKVSRFVHHTFSPTYEKKIIQDIHDENNIEKNGGFTILFTRTVIAFFHSPGGKILLVYLL